MKTLYVLYQFDNKYAPYAGISMESLLEHVKNVEVHILCAGMDVDFENVLKINELIKKYNQTISWLDIDEAVTIIKDMNVGSWNGSKATWIKMFIIHKLPKTIHRILYLDSDTLITGDISSILDVDISEYYAGCALDSVGQRCAKMIGTTNYYNAGVIWFNVDRWREDLSFDHMLDHLRKHINEYPDNEQRLLNDYFRGKILTISPKYNFQGIHKAYSSNVYFSIYKYENYYSISEIESAHNNPIVFHFFRFLGDYPWEKGNIHPMKKEFLMAKRKSLWSDDCCDKKRKSFVYTIEKILYCFLPQKTFLRLYKYIVERFT